MKKILTGLLVAVLVGTAIAAAAAFTGGQIATAQENQNNQAPAQQAQTPVAYKYVAQPSDSYTKLARKAVQTYGIKHNVKLTLAGIVFAETNMTKEAGSPQMSIGQQVEISEDIVKKWADQAQKLTAEQQTAWNHYVQFVDFNTDSIGEAR